MNPELYSEGLEFIEEQMEFDEVIEESVSKQTKPVFYDPSNWNGDDYTDEREHVLYEDEYLPISMIMDPALIITIRNRRIA